MAWVEVIWTDGPQGNVQHIAEHGITSREVEQVLANPIHSDMSKASRRPIVFGYTAGGRFLAVVYEPVDETTVYPITAFEIED
ncbi:MAG: DUF4258 domain-containing protein [Planctomycetota bacterium]|jgi:uncharacterized DUF497 family protein